jgi:CHAD domain-containing protein
MTEARVATRFACDADFSVNDLLQRLQHTGTLHGPVAARVDEVYLDTRTDELAGAGLSARLREVAGVRTVALVVVPIDPAVTIDAPPVERAFPRGADVGEGIRAWVRERFGWTLSEAPREVLTLVIARRRWAHVTDAGSTEFVVDEVSASEPHGRRARFTELAIEGGGSVLGALGRQGGHTVARRSTFERARDALGLGEYRYGTKPAALDPEDLLVDAARAVVAAWWSNACAHAPGVRVGLDPEHVHKMRVALRRLRTALRLFDDAFDDAALTAVRDRVRTLARALGEVRDLDVQLESLGRWRDRFAMVDALGWDDVALRIERRRSRARARALVLLEGEPWRLIAADLERCLAPDSRGLRHTVGAVAGGLVAKGAERCSRAIRRLDEGGAEEAHALRIDIKNLRYSLDFLGVALPGALDIVEDRLAQLQEGLGNVQDDVQTGAFAAQLVAMAPPPPSATAFALGTLVGYGRARADLASAIARAAVAEVDFTDALAQLVALGRGDERPAAGRGRRG